MDIPTISVGDLITGSGDIPMTDLIVFGAIILCLFVGAWSRAQARKRADEWQEHAESVHGEAHVMSLGEMEKHPIGWLARNNPGVIIGREGAKHRLVRYKGDRHMITFAPTGAGKLVNTVAPNALTYRGSLLAIDPKGELAAVTARARREMGQAVHILDPWELAGQGCQGWNPLDWLAEDNPDLIEDAMLIAEALVVSERSGTGDASHWASEARNLLRGLILYVALYEEPDRRNLLTVRDMLTYDPEDWQGLLEAMLDTGTDAGGVIRRTAAQLLQKSDRERASVVSTAQSNTNFLDSPRMAKVLSRSDFDIRDLKRSRISIYLVLPADRLTTFSRWLRLMVQFAIVAASRVWERPEHRILMMLDEFAALGHLRKVEDAVALMRGYGLWFWPILQDLPQLKAIYPLKWESFISNAGIIQAFGVSDQTTSEYLSKLCGQYTEKVPGDILKGDDGGPTVNVQPRPLFLPQEIRSIDNANELIRTADEEVMLIGKVRYYEEKEFAGLHDPNPYITGVRPKVPANDASALPSRPAAPPAAAVVEDEVPEDEEEEEAIAVGGGLIGPARRRRKGGA